jgi:discoidin domain receptor family member 2
MWWCVFIFAGAGWVGWRNDTLRSRFVELIFEFDQVRNFSAVNLYTNNFFSKDAQVSQIAPYARSS